MNDIMNRLADARPPHLAGDGAADPVTRETELGRAIAQPRRDTRRRGRGRLIVPLAALGAAGAAAAALMVIPGGEDGRRPPGNSGVVRANPVLLAAADKAERQPMGRYWHTDYVSAQSYIVKGGYAISGARDESFHRTSRGRGGGDLFYGRSLPAEPLTLEDEKAWRAAGSPSSFRVLSNGLHVTYTTKTGAWDADTHAAGPGGAFFIPQVGSMTPEQLRNLPTRPAALAKIFFAPVRRSRLQEGNPSAQTVKRFQELSKWENDPAHMLLRAGEVFTNAPLSPAVRAGLMRALAAQHGVRSLGTVTDALGRRGIAFGADWSPVRPGRLTKKGGLRWERMGYLQREELIFDAKTGEYLGDQAVLVRPGGLYHTRKPGFVIRYDLMRSSGWTDDKPVPPTKPPS